MGVLDILKKIPTAKEMKGGFGEYLTKYYSKLVLDGLVIHDVLIDGEDGYTSQIDLVIVGLKGVYVVEVKFFEDARIYGDGKKSKWYYYRGGKKFDIYSPLKQNKKHITYLKEFLKDLDCSSFSSGFTEKGIVIICVPFSRFSLNDILFRSTLLLMSLSQSRLAKSSRISSDEYPRAYNPPTIEPILVPAI